MGSERVNGVPEYTEAPGPSPVRQEARLGGPAAAGAGKRAPPLVRSRARSEFGVSGIGRPAAAVAGATDRTAGAESVFIVGAMVCWEGNARLRGQPS